MNDTKQIILDTIDGAAREMLIDLSYIEYINLSGAIESGIISIDEIVAAFKKSIENQLENGR